MVGDERHKESLKTSVRSSLIPVNHVFGASVGDASRIQLDTLGVR